MAEHPAVNRRVVSSSLTCGANFPKQIKRKGRSQEWPFVFCAAICAKRFGCDVSVDQFSLNLYWRAVDHEGWFQRRGCRVQCQPSNV